MRRVGFTATRAGLTSPQVSRLIAWVILQSRCEGHHGDCIGGDASLHETILYHGWRIVAHPASGVGTQRAYCMGCAGVREPKPPLDRNTDIVNETEELVALPDGPERQRSGTWSTVRKARRAGRQVTIIWPDGSITVEPARLAEGSPEAATTPIPAVSAIRRVFSASKRKKSAPDP